MAALALAPALTQADAKTPYTFKSTGISVYSFEEALYHARQFWRDCADELTDAEFSGWVAEALGLPYLARRIRSEVSAAPSFSDGLLAFFSLTDYFSGEKLSGIRNELTRWENRLEWERLKDRADALCERGEAAGAYQLYRRAVKFAENPAILNNMGVALLKLKKYAKALETFGAAARLEPENREIQLNLAEAAIYAGDTETAKSFLEGTGEAGQGQLKTPSTEGALGGQGQLKTPSEEKSAKKRKTDAPAQAPDPAQAARAECLRGEIALSLNNYKEAARRFEAAYKINRDPLYIYKIADIFLLLRRFPEAAETIRAVREPGPDHPLKLARALKLSGNYTEAAAVLREALSEEGAPKTPGKDGSASAAVWTELAECLLLNMDEVSAAEAVSSALSIDPVNERALFVQAKIKKRASSGEYRAALRKVLSVLKKRCRDFLSDD
ncbi:MAG: tetratricopeptide repeat protein [Clostridiales bacterium]|jgi:tetratricopeptide (TPR) repeat protein|nr:tetratricopeptide repeat protein [Clostridiales bacterium]